MTALVAEPRPEQRSDSLRRRHRGLVAVFSLTGGVGSALLFLVEPMMARQLLPRLGGSAAIWNTAMVFFQGALLAGYLAANMAQRRSPRGSRAAILGLLLAGLLPLPLALPAWSPPNGGEAAWIVAILAVSVGVPFVALASLGPTLQAWFAETSHPRAADPYFLYAAGNIGSVVGLLAYPVVVEPTLGLVAQRRLWSVGYLLAVGLCVACVVVRRANAAPTSARSASPGVASSTSVPSGVDAPTVTDRLRWIVLAAVPSGLLLGVTRHLSTDVAAVPLLWVLPLLAYLATFVVAFRSGAAPSERLLRFSLLISLPLIATMTGGVGSAVVAVVIGIAGFTLLALVCHARLASERPATDWLTGYYLWISFGGALGGVTVALVAPVVFTRVTEYPLLIVAALIIVALTAPRTPTAGRSVTLAVTALVVIGAWWLSRLGADRAALVTQVLGVGGGVIYVVARSPRRIAIALTVLTASTVFIDARASLDERRTFFGVYRVRTDEQGRHVFEHGTTIHGEQIFEPSPRLDPLTYYTPDSGVGRVYRALQQSPEPLDSAVVGLGAGTLAAYGRPQDRLDFYEIDGEVVRIAENPRLFTFLRDTRAEVRTFVGDGRLELASQDRPLDVLVLDAFSSDAIPVHLLTAEAMASYRDRLAPGGVIAVHISNRFFDLAPVIARLGDGMGWQAHRLETPVSTWMLLSGEDAPASLRDELRGWDRVRAAPEVPLWTDDFSNLLSALN